MSCNVKPLNAQTNSVPIGVEFGEDTYQKNFASGVDHHFLLFTSAKAEGHQDVTVYFKKVAKEFKGKVRIDDLLKII